MFVPAAIASSAGGVSNETFATLLSVFCSIRGTSIVTGRLAHQRQRMGIFAIQHAFAKAETPPPRNHVV